MDIINDFEKDNAFLYIKSVDASTNTRDGEGKDCDCGKANLIEEYSGYRYRLFRLIKRLVTLR